MAGSIAILINLKLISARKKEQRAKIIVYSCFK
jgi:hypothetical protein